MYVRMCGGADASDGKKALLSNGYWDSIHVVEVGAPASIIG